MSGSQRAILRVQGGPDDGTVIDLSKDMTSMGRAAGNDVVVEASGVSRQHAGIRKSADGYWIEDLGSRNGTYVHGEPIEGEGRSLRDGDRIELGSAGGSGQWVFREMGATVAFEVPRSSVG